MSSQGNSPTPDQLGAVFVATDFSFGGANTIITGAAGQCVNVPSGFNDDISSVGPDPGQSCFFFSDFDCGGSRIGPISSPGVADLTTTTPPFNDMLLLKGSEFRFAGDRQSPSLSTSSNFSTELGDENKRNQGILILRYWEILRRKPKLLEIKGMALFLATFSQRTMGVGDTD
ncbi:hypothetical protein C8J56DRAFT_1024116 [Mycena floridula]|nr:hypothetical protein C8J56DRAFT_1024116 [Mycena floridula]